MLRIATFNLESLDDDPKEESGFARRVDALRPALVALDADILCLQEINARRPRPSARRELSALRRVIEGTRYAGYELRSTALADGRLSDRHNIATLSRFPVLETQVLRHDLVAPIAFPAAAAPGSQAAAIEWDRPILRTAHDLGGRRLHVLNLHLRAPLASVVPGGKVSASAWRSAASWAEGFFISAVKRTGQALEARLAIDAIFDREPGALVAVAGDLNADSFEMPLRVIQAAVEETGNPALAMRAMTPVERRVPDARRFSAIHAGRRMLVDHILVSAALAERLGEVRIANERLPDDTEAGAGAASFHAAIVAAFDLPG